MLDWYCNIIASGSKIVLPVLLFFVAHQSQGQLYATPIPSEKIYALDQYSVRSPAGQNWFELKYDKRDIYFGKKLSSPTHSFIALSMAEPVSEKLATPGDFLDFFGKLMLPSRADRRNAILEHSSRLDESAGRYCVRYWIKSSDRDAVNARGKTLFSETFGVACLHPENSNLMIDASYTERGHPAEFDQALRAEGESFLRSLKFLPRPSF